MQTKEEAFARLAKSKFRSSFHLTAAEKAFCAEKGGEVLRRHAADFVRQKLAPAYPLNDGKQTPMHGHPVFKAMHATACCCRGCMNKWYHIPLGVELSDDLQTRIVDYLMAWIERSV
jgi:hypothetical protein